MPRVWRSATEYPLREEQTDAVVGVASYRRSDYHLSVLQWFSPREHVGIRLSIATPFRRTSDAGLGRLDLLPRELLDDIMLRMDVLSLFNFRQTNLRSRQTVDSLRQYQLVVVHGLNLLCALLRTRLATGVSLFDFYYALCTKACALCGDFGGIMSLLTWTRCCLNCVLRAPEIQVRSLASVRKQFRLTKAKVDQLRSFKTFPGIDSMDESVCKPRRITLVSAHQAILVSGQQPPDASIAQAQPANTRRGEEYNSAGSCALPYYDRRTGRVDHGMSCAGCQLALKKGIGIISTSQGPAVWAFEARDNIYSQDGFVEHFRWCEQAQLLWTSSGEGTKHPPELPL